MSYEGLNVARLLLPAVRWSTENGWDGYRDAIERGLEMGVGGFILFGGPVDAVRALTSELHSRARHALLIASDLERGAGQQFRGATPLPPAAAIGWLNDPAITERAGELTAREARALGVNWIYAPVADVDLEPENPIIGVRAFGTDPDNVALHVAAWVRGCARGGALSCAKHFPGHGRTVGDSHVEKPTVRVDRASLEKDLAPFRSASQAGADSVMTAHVAYPALDPDGQPATLSTRILVDLLRDEIGFEGLVVTDAIIMEGLTEGGSEATASVQALAAGCDVLLYPQDAEAVIREVQAAIGDGRLSRRRVEDALRRTAAAAEKYASSPEGGYGWDDDRRWALDIAVRSLRVCRGHPELPARVRLEEVEDDLGGPWPPYPRDAFPAALRSAGIEIADDGAPLVAVYSDIRAWKGRPGISAVAQEKVRAITEAHPDATVVLFSHPRLAHELPTARHLLAAWGGEAIMQQAAVAWLTGTEGGLVELASGLDR
ncbi:MAG: GH3 [uncultured Gemmatimonadetes bacterium]|uniref:beta-N-acetylhexosaminidase n=1 Tax=uncultured Gemmatimonadota bacterium TaxID=203437 RepID=A0A6J4MIF6_9BACT|nr:MAG: GH3 [uncultured Gemmatimonadota bacterium]